MDRPPADERLAPLMQRYQQGDVAAFEELYALTQPVVARYLARFSGAADPGELTQETYLQLVRARRAFHPERPFLPFLLAIARHVAHQALRTRRRRFGREVGGNLPDAGGPSPEPSFALRVDLERALDALPPPQRELAWLAWVLGLTAPEIAAVTGATAIAIKLRLNRLARRLRAQLGDGGTTPAANEDRTP
jgi:RNA polymerase sigma-70 factor (ECF subfamily)